MKGVSCARLNQVNFKEDISTTYPRSMAARHTERTVASDTVHSPSERKMRTGDLWGVNRRPGMTHRNHAPFVTPMLNHDRLCCSQSLRVIGPTPRLVRRDAVQEIIWRASKIVRDTSSRRTFKQDHAVCVSARNGRILPNSVDSCLTGSPESME